MPIHFVFSTDSSEPSRPEEMFADQWSALRQAGFSASLCSDAVLAGTKPLRDVPPGSAVVYRGWMIKGEEYAALARAIEQTGANAFTSPHEYLASHHLPNWYPLLSDLTPGATVTYRDRGPETISLAEFRTRFVLSDAEAKTFAETGRHSFPDVDHAEVAYPLGLLEKNKEEFKYSRTEDGIPSSGQRPG